MQELTWRQIADEIAARIESGEMPPGTRVESEESMSQRLNVPRHTAHRALRELQLQGLVIRQRRWGTVVADRKKPVGKRRIAYLVDVAGNRFQADIMAHIEHALDAETRLLVATSKNDPDREAEHLLTLRDEVDGIICYPADGDTNAQVFLDLAQSGYPLVLVDRAPRGCEDFVVLTDNGQASEHAVTDLVAKGHQRIAFFGSSNSHAQSVRERFQGYRNAIEPLGYFSRPYERWIPLLLEENSEMMYQTISDGFAVMRTLAEPPTAAFCVQDRLAQILIEACAGHGLEVGVDFSIVTYNDFGSNFFRHPWRISRIVQQMEDVSLIAVDRLRALMRGESVPPGPVRVPAKFFPAEEPSAILASSLFTPLGNPTG